MNSSTQKLSVVEKVGYSMGDLAANLVFQTFMTFIAYYYTDVYKLEQGDAQWVIFTCGMLGGVVFAPIMGMIADRTRTRWGRYRPWILWTTIPFAGAILAAFTTPDFAYDAKLIYAATTYLLLVTLYTANNLPYASLSGVLTGNMAERNSLSSYRFVAVMVAQFIIQVLLRPIVLVVGDGDEAAGFEKTMMFFAIFSVILLYITFFTTRERVIESKSESSSIAQDLTDLLNNKPWLIMLCVVVLVFVNLSLKSGTYVYYFRYFADTDATSAFLAKIGFTGFIDGIQSVFPNFKWPEEVDASAFGLFNGSGIIMMVVGIFFSKFFADKYGKKAIYTGFLFLSTLPIIAFVFVPSDGLGAMFILQIFHGLTYGVTIPIMWAMIADVADYSEWKNHRRATAIIFSAMILGLKGGLAIGGTLVVTFLSFFDYQAGVAEQAESASTGIKYMVSLIAAAPFLASCALLLLYPINKKVESEIESDLAARHAGNTP